MSTSRTFKSGKDSELTSDQLHDALRSMWDMMEYYEWYPTLDTALAIKQQNGLLMKDKISGAIHTRHLIREVRSAIKTQLDYWQSRNISDPYEMTDDYIKWTYKGVPVELKILKRRYSFFNNPDPVTYNYDDYKLANPFDKYWPARFIVR